MPGGTLERRCFRSAALALLKTLAAEGRPATTDDRAVLARFSGFGDSTFEPAFRLSAHRPEDQPWVERGQRLRSLLDDGEWQSLERSRLNAFFTSPDVIVAVWDGLLALGLGSLPAPRILEPAAGVGRFLGLQPKDTATRSVRTAIELRRPVAQSVWACAALSEAMRWSTRLPARSTLPRYLHTASGSSNGSTTSLTHSMPSSRRH